MAGKYRMVTGAGAILLAAACSSGTGGGQDANVKARADFERACSTCHTLEMVLGKEKTLGGWKETVHRMRIKGAAVSENEGEAIAAYLYSIKPAR